MICSPISVCPWMKAHSSLVERRRLVQDRVRHRHLADVVELGGVADRLDPRRAAARTRSATAAASSATSRPCAPSSWFRSATARSRTSFDCWRRRDPPDPLVGVHALVGDRERGARVVRFARQEHGPVRAPDRETVALLEQRLRRSLDVSVRGAPRSIDQSAELVAPDPVRAARWRRDATRASLRGGAAERPPTGARRCRCTA